MPKPITLADDALHIMIIDDDRRIRSLLARFLKENGYRVSSCSCTEDALQLMKLFIFDLLIVDVMLPGQSGIDMVDYLSRSATPNPPILFLTALNSTSDRIKGLEVGGDDYLSKPFDPRELLLRINNILKRLPSDNDRQESISLGSFILDPQTGNLTDSSNQIIKLSERERSLLVLFASNIGVTISRDELVNRGDLNNERTVDVQINRLRRKIEDDPANPRYLLTVRGLGYKLLSDKT